MGVIKHIDKQIIDLQTTIESAKHNKSIFTTSHNSYSLQKTERKAVDIESFIKSVLGVEEAIFGKKYIIQ